MSKRILAFDIGADSVKFAEFRHAKDGSLVLEKYGVRPLGLDPTDEGSRLVYTGSTISELMQEYRVKPGPVLLSVSGQNVFSRYVKLPPVAGDKIGQIIEYEAKQNVPYPLEEVVWDRQILPGSGEDMDVLLAAIKQDILEGLTDTVSECGLEPELVDISIAAIYNSYRYNEPDTDECTLIVDMGARTTNLIFAERDRLFSRSVPVSGSSISQQIARDFDVSFGEAEEMKCGVSMVGLGGAYEPLEDPEADQVSKCIRGVMTKMHAEINRSINYYRSQQNGAMPTRVLLTGGSSVMTYLDVFLQEKLGLPVAYLNPFANVFVSKGVDEELVAQDAHLLSGVVGLALRSVGETPVSLNLLPPAIVRERIFRKKQGVIIASLFVAAAIAGVWGWVGLKKNAHAETHLEAVKSEVATLRSWQSRIAAVDAQVALVKRDVDALSGMVARRAEWMAVVEEIQKHVPAGVWIQQIRVKEAAGSSTALDPRRLQLIGVFYKDRVYANPRQPNNEKIVAFRDALRASPLFSEETSLERAPTELGQQDATPERNIVGFLIEVVLEKELPL